MSKLGAKKLSKFRNQLALGESVEDPRVIKLAEIQHLGKHSDALALALSPDDAVIKMCTAPRHTTKGPSVRRVFRRNKRRLSSLDAKVARKTGKPLYSPGQRVKLLQRKVQKYVKQARQASAILINATLAGVVRPASFFPPAPKLDAYHQRIAEVGTSISEPNLNTAESHANV